MSIGTSTTNNPKWRFNRRTIYNYTTKQFEVLPEKEGFVLERLMGDGKTYLEVANFTCGGIWLDFICDRQWTIEDDEDFAAINDLIRNFFKK